MYFTCSCIYDLSKVDNGLSKYDIVLYELLGKKIFEIGVSVV